MIDADQVKLQLQFLGKTAPTTRYRAIWPNREDKIPARKLPLSRSAVEQCADEGFNSYFVVGNGGDSDTEITNIPAAFGEWDDGDKTWQMDAWAAAELPTPTFQVDTGGKSIHHYWVFEEPAPPAVWIEIQKRLIAAAGFDRTLVNPSRVMRLAGAPHQKTGQLARVLNVTGVRYNAIELLDSLPPVPEAVVSLPEPREWASSTLDDIRAALAMIPARPGAGSGTYATYRNILWGLVAACEEAGGSRDDAIAMMQVHSPDGWDITQVAKSGGAQIKAATFWWHAREFGYKLERGPGEAKRARLKIEAHINPEACGENMWMPIGTGWDGEKQTRALPHRLADLISSTMPDIWHNMMTGEVMYGKTPLSGDELELAFSRIGALGWAISKENAQIAIRQSALVRKRHPIREYLESCETPLPDADWADVANHLLGPGHDPFDSAVLRKWLIFAVARVYQPGCPFGIMLILAGSQQMHKTRTFNCLAGDEWFLGGFQKSHNEKDDLVAMSRKWLIEWAELDGGLTKHSSAELKAFIDKRDDTYRRAYGVKTETTPRGFAFCGTTNLRGDLFQDPTGNRRYAVIEIHERINSAKIEALRDQVWASALRDYKNRCTWFLSDEELAINNSRNLGLMSVDPWVEPVQDMLDKISVSRTATGLRYVRQSWVLKEIEGDVGKWGRLTGSRLGEILRGLGWRRQNVRMPGEKHPKTAWVEQGGDDNPGSAEAPTM